MIRSAITVSLVPEARGGPFVYWNGLADACQKASALGFDAIEIFAPGPDAVDAGEITGLLKKHNLAVAAVGTGAGMVKHNLSLTDGSADRRAEAVEFVKSMIDFGATHDAPAIIGSMQGRHGGDVSAQQARRWLGDALNVLGRYAQAKGTRLIYEPLNRYETNLINTVAAGVELLESIDTDNVRLLADLFHMNIEESDFAAALIDGGSHIGHVHYVDSNRRAAGLGHIDFAPVAAALKRIGYDGYLCAEALPLPNSDTAAKKTIESFHEHYHQPPT